MNVFKPVLLQISVLSMFLSPAANSAIALDRTRVIFDGSQKSITLSISNQNKQLPYLAQGWLESEEGKKIQSPLTVLPPVQRIESGKSSQIKIQSLPSTQQLPQNKETLFYFNLREIPPRSEKPNTLQIALQTRVKLFYRPSAIAIDQSVMPVQEKLTLIRQGDNYLVHNPTAYYITIVDAGMKKGAKGVEGFAPMLIPPEKTMPLTVSAKKVGNSPVLTYINDYGARPQLTFNCSASKCKVTQDNDK